MFLGSLLPRVEDSRAWIREVLSPPSVGISLEIQVQGLGEMDLRTNGTGFHPQHCLVIPHPTQNNTNRDRRHNARERDLSAMH